MFGMPIESLISTLAPELILLLGAMVCLMMGVFRNDHEDLIIHGFAAILTVAAAMVLIDQKDVAQEIFSGRFVRDGLAVFMKILILIATFFVLLISMPWQREGEVKKFEFSILVLLSAVGMMVMVSAHDLITLYMGLELQSLALYVLAAIHRDDSRSSEAGLKYFVLGALSSCLLLYGSSLIYGFTGSTDFGDIASSVAVYEGQPVGFLFGLVFVLAGLAFKISAVPFHMWTPDVYEGAPTPVTAFFAAAPKVAAIGLLTRVSFSAFQPVFEAVQQVTIFLAIASMILGAVAAIGQSNIKRMLAYSSIGHMGFVLVGLSAGGQSGLQSVLVYTALYVAMSVGSFACVLALKDDQGRSVENIYDLAGLSRHNPLFAFVFALLMFSLAGIPPLAGFFAKLFVLSAAFEAGLWPLAIVGIIASLIAAFYYLRVINIMYFNDAKIAFGDLSFEPKIVAYIFGAFIALYFIQPAFLIDAAARAAQLVH